MVIPFWSGGEQMHTRIKCINKRMKIYLCRVFVFCSASAKNVPFSADVMYIHCTAIRILFCISLLRIILCELIYCSVWKNPDPRYICTYTCSSMYKTATSELFHAIVVWRKPMQLPSVVSLCQFAFESYNHSNSRRPNYWRIPALKGSALSTRFSVTCKESNLASGDKLCISFERAYHSGLDCRE